MTSDHPQVGPGGTGGPAFPTDTVRVWDPFIRVFHWSLAVFFFVAYFTEDDILTVHVWAGYAAGALVVLRILWGLVGPRYARFSDFVYRPSVVLGYMKGLLRHTARRYTGHSPAGGAMVVALIVVLLCVVVSGMVLYGLHDGAGPFAYLDGYGGRSFRRSVKEIHEILSSLAIALVIAHVIGVLLASYVHGENLVLAMFTGRKRKDD